MGQVCSSGAVAKQVTVARDPEDQELDEVEMNETKIPDFDSFFERAAAPLNEMVEIHNGIYLSDENLKQAAAAMQGETQLRIVVASSVTLEFWHFDDNENEVVFSPEQVEEKVNVNLALKAANDKTKFAVDQLNETLADASSGSPSQIVAKRGRLLVTKKGDQDGLARSVNIALFSLRKELAKAAHISSLSEAVKIFFKEVSKCEDISALSVKTDENGAFKLMNGDKEFDLKKLDKLSKPATQFRDALVELMENVQTAATSVPELAEQSSAFATEAQDFPAKVPEAAKAADLGFSEVPSALKSTASNVKALGNGPHIAKSTTAMIKYAGTELAQAISKPAGV